MRKFGEVSGRDAEMLHACLRLQGQDYVITGHFDGCKAYVEACSSQQKTWARAEGLVSITDLSVAIESLLSAVGQRVPNLLPARPREDCVKHGLVLKFLVAILASRESQVDWEVVRAAPFLHAIGLDLGWLPIKTSAADISRLFFDRADWAIFLGILGSLWDDVAEHYSDREDDLMLAVIESAFGSAPLSCPSGGDMQSALPLSYRPWAGGDQLHRWEREGRQPEP